MEEVRPLAEKIRRSDAITELPAGHAIEFSVGVNRGAATGAGDAVGAGEAEASSRTRGVMTSLVDGVNKVDEPAWAWAEMSASAQANRKLSLGSAFRACSHTVTPSGVVSPNASIEPRMRGSMPTATGRPWATANWRVKMPLGPVSSVNSAAVSRPDVLGGGTMARIPVKAAFASDDEGVHTNEERPVAALSSLSR